MSNIILSRNVGLTIAAIGLDSLAQSIWLETIFPVYLYLILGNSNTMV